MLDSIRNLLNRAHLAIAESDLAWMRHNHTRLIAQQEMRVRDLRRRCGLAETHTHPIARRACREKIGLLAGASE